MCDPVDSAFCLDLGVVQPSGFSQAFPGAEQTTLSAWKKITEDARNFLEECLGQESTPVGLDDPGKWPRMMSELEDIMIETDEGNIAQNVRGPSSTSGHGVLFHFLRYVAYLSTNNLLPDEKLDKVVGWLIENGKFWILTHLVGIKSPTTEILASNVFLSAARIQSEFAVRSLLAKGISPNVIEVSYRKRTALRIAVYERNSSLVRTLLEAGANPNASYRRNDRSSSTALTEALQGINPAYDLADLLIKHGADVNPACPADGDYPLTLAVRLGNVDLIRVMLNAGAELNKIDNRTGTLLQIAAKMNDNEVVEALVRAGADVNCPNGERYVEACLEAKEKDFYFFFRTPLQRAVQENNFRIVEMLLEAGADVNGFPAGSYFYEWLNRSEPDTSSDEEEYSDTESDSSTSSNSSAGNESDLCKDADFWYWNVADKKDRLCTALQEAVLGNNIALVRLFLSLGAHVDTMGSQGTALQIASRDPGKINLVRLFLQSGANANAESPKVGSTALVAAVKSGDEGLVKVLLDANADVEAPTYDGNTPLQVAAEMGKMRIIRLLLDAGACVNVYTSPNIVRTPLQGAVLSHNMDLVRLFIEAGGDINSKPSSRKGRTCLQIACEGGDTRMFDYLLELGAHVNDCTTRAYGYTALQAATKKLWDPDSRENCVYMVQKLLELGADPNIPGPTCPLRKVVESEDQYLTELLLRKKADPNGQGHRSRPLQIAVYNKSVEMIRCLLNFGADANRTSAKNRNMPLSIAVRKGADLELIKTLVDEGGASLTGIDGTLALIESVKLESVEVVRFLLERRVEPNLPRHLKKRSAVSTAVWSSTYYSRYARSPRINLDMLKLLVAYGADVNKRHGRDPLQSASRKEDLGAVQILLNAGADVNSPAIGREGQTALQEAVWAENMTLVKSLIDAGADVNAPPSTKWGKTALQVAVDRNDMRMVKFLLSKGASVNGPCSKYHGATALQLAAINGNLPIALVLLRQGADINAPAAPVGGRTALEAAAEHGRLDIAYLLLHNDGDMETVESRCKEAAELASSERHYDLARILRDWKKSS